LDLRGQEKRKRIVPRNPGKKKDPLMTDLEGKDGQRRAVNSGEKRGYLAD